MRYVSVFDWAEINNNLQERIIRNIFKCKNIGTDFSRIQDNGKVKVTGILSISFTHHGKTICILEMQVIQNTVQVIMQ